MKVRVIRYSQSSCLCGIILIISWVFWHSLLTVIGVEAVLFIGHFPSNHIIMILITGVITSVVYIWGSIVVNIFYIYLGALLGLQHWRFKFLFVPLSCRRVAFLIKKDILGGSVFKSLLANVHSYVHFVEKWKIQCLVWIKVLARLLCSTY